MATPATQPTTNNVLTMMEKRGRTVFGEQLDSGALLAIMMGDP